MDVKTWKSINIADIFKISYGNKLDMCDMTLQKDGIAFVTRTSKNNGIGGYVVKLENKEPYPPKCLTVALGGSIGSTFLQKQPFYTSQNIAVLEPRRELPDEILLVIATLIKKECDKRFIAFGRELNKHINKDFTIKLPIAVDGQPDWTALRCWLNSVVIPKLPKKTKEIWSGMQMNKPLHSNGIELTDRTWKWFNLVPDIFCYSKGKRLTKADSIEGDMPLVTAGESNQGVSRLVANDMETFSNCLTIDMFGYCAYRGYEFCCDDNILVLLPKEEMSNYTMLFLATVINQDCYKYAYGRQYRQKTLLKHKIKLPATSNGTPDWQFMEDYIKSLPYSGNL